MRTESQLTGDIAFVYKKIKEQEEIMRNANGVYQHAEYIKEKWNVVLRGAVQEKTILTDEKITAEKAAEKKELNNK